MLPLAAMMLVTSLQAGRLSQRFGSKRALLIGSCATCLSMLILLVAHSAPWNLYLVMGIFGLGLGLAFAALGNLIVEAVPRTQTGVASGMNAVMRTLGGAAGSAVAATLVAATVRHGLPLERGYTQAMAAMAGVLGLGALACLWVPRRQTAPRGEAISGDGHLGQGLAEARVSTRA